MANELTDLIDKINRAVRNDKNLRIALTTTLATHKPRIFERGQDANLAQIGTYSTSPTSISYAKQARNTGHTFFKGGYAQYKSEIGKNPGRVILRDSDQMYADYGLQGSNLDYGFGFQNQFNYDKSQWLETKYQKKIFYPSEQDNKVTTDVLTAQLRQELK